MKIMGRISRLRNLVPALENFLNSTSGTIQGLQKELEEIREFIKANLTVQSKSEIDYLFLRLSDLSSLLVQSKKVVWRVETNKPVAIDSNDHLHPRGVKQDETRKPAFVKQLIEMFGPQVSYLDLGCAGGGLVYDFILENCLALGIEGSDYSKNHARAYWREIPWALQTADLTAPLQVFLEDHPAKFDVIGAWEFFEHIEEEKVPAVLENIKRHLRNENSLFLANIATFEDTNGHTHWHETIKDVEWWTGKFEESGFKVVQYPFEQSLNPRGSGNTFGTWGNDYNIQVSPEMGFAIAIQLL